MKHLRMSAGSCMHFKKINLVVQLEHVGEWIQNLQLPKNYAQICKLVAQNLETKSDMQPNSVACI